MNGPDTTTAEGHLFLLAFDHRGFFQRNLLGHTDDPTDYEVRRIEESKRLICDGAVVAARGVPEGEVGIIVDDRFGDGVPQRAREAGLLVAMPAERSERTVFEFEHGEGFGEQILDADPDITKVLVRYNVEGDRAANELQATRLRELSGWLAANRRRFLCELIVEPTGPQLADSGDDVESFEATRRPVLICAAIAELQDAGVEPEIWKVEGLERAEDAVAICERARRGGRDHVVCVLLGSGAPAARVRRWLRVIARVDGFVGFAIGRSIWWPPLQRHLAGEIDRERAVDEIAHGYRECIELFLEERAA